MFLAVISYVLGIFMETFIPRRGFLRYLNPVNQFTQVRYFILSIFPRGHSTRKKMLSL